jgi:trimethylamine--corrinoid protein Co-methyltransferase
MLDVELLTQFRRLMNGIGSSEEEMAFDALAELGPGGLFLASPHTRAHFKEWLYLSPLFQTPDFATWQAMGGERTDVVANRMWKQLLERYEDPGIDDAVDAELRFYIERRRQEPAEPDD